jgi:hypothetical protein
VLNIPAGEFLEVEAGAGQLGENFGGVMVAVAIM